VQRVWQHRNGLVEGFTKKYGVHRLVYFELHDDMETRFFARSGSRSGTAIGNCA
jgi:putative endonuclease